MPGATGPAPKHPSERRNKTPPARGEWIEIDKPVLDHDEIKLRALKPLEKARLNQKARDKWNVWRREPVTVYWSQSEISFALDTLELFSSSDWTRHAAEIRLREDRLGLTPKGKRDLRFKIMYGHGREASKDRPPPASTNGTASAEVVNLDVRRQQLAHGA